MGLDFSIMHCGTGLGRRTALVITPTAHIRITRARLEELRMSGEPPSPSTTDRMVLEAATQWAPDVQFTIFRGCDDTGRGSWAFDDDIRGEDANELAYYLLREQMGVYRGLVRAGLLLHLHVDWPHTELCAYREATLRLRDELREAVIASGGPDQADPCLLADLWILRHLTFYFGVRFNALLDAFLPESLPMMERRIGRAQQLMAAVAE